MTTPSRIQSFSPDEQAFIRDFSDYVARFELGFESRGENGEGLLRIAGYRPIPWHARLGGKRVGRRTPETALYEEAATAAITYFFEHMKVSTFYDVGAFHHGYFSRLALCYQAYPIDIYAFEMRPDFHARLAAGLDGVGEGGRRIEPLLAGLTDRHVGETEMWYSRTRLFETMPGAAEYREPWWIRLKFALRGDHDRNALHRARVEITSIDHFSRARKLVPDLVKIDVEGYEAKVLPGGMAVFAAHRPIILLELHRQKLLDRFGVSRREVLRPLFAIGYRALLFSSHSDRVSPILPVTAESAAIDRDRTNMVVLY